MNGTIHFDEAFNGANIPTVTLIGKEGVRASFILDTGSSSSVINIEDLSLFDCVPNEVKYESMSACGNVSVCDSYIISFSDEDGEKYNDVFMAMDMSSAIDTCAEEYGVHISGVIGGTFFTKYRCTIDYKNRKLGYETG